MTEPVSREDRASNLEHQTSTRVARTAALEERLERLQGRAAARVPWEPVGSC